MYIENFKDHGYDDTTFLIGMKEQDLLDIGVSNRGHRRKLLREIERLPPEEMDCNVPVSLSISNKCAIFPSHIRSRQPIFLFLNNYVLLPKSQPKGYSVTTE